MFSGSGPAYPYDLAKAKQLLKEAGFDKGFDLTILAAAGNADQAGISTVLQQFWSQLGVRLKIEQFDNATVTAKYRAADFQIRNGRLDGRHRRSQRDRVLSLSITTTSSRCMAAGDDPRAHELFKQSQLEPDPAKRAAEFKEMQQLYAARRRSCFPMRFPTPWRCAKKVQGFTQIPLGNNIFVDTYLQQ